MTQLDAPTPALECPFAHAAPAIARSSADERVRRLLRIPPQPHGVERRSAVNVFTRSMAFSTLRCTLTYLVFPFVLPALGLVSGAGVALGFVIGGVAIVCNVFTIRRVFAADHRWRWRFSIVAVLVIGMLTVLLVQDVASVVV